MTKKASIFNILKEYFGTHPLSVAGWIWVAVTPLLGSLILASQYFWVEKISLYSIWDHIGLTLAISLILGIALLPTTLTSLAVGFFWGWLGFPSLIFGYVFANVIGYSLGGKLNADFLTILYHRNPKLELELEKRKDRPGSLIFFVRISPVIPFAISNFIFASLKVPLKNVLLFGIPGMLPRTFVAFATGMITNSFLGAKESINQPSQLIFLGALLLLSLVGLYWSWKKGKN